MSDTATGASACPGDKRYFVHKRFLPAIRRIPCVYGDVKSDFADLKAISITHPMRGSRFRRQNAKASLS
jgi:hypothetical protein